MGDGFVPVAARRTYAKRSETPIAAAHRAFDFVEDPKRWGAKFRFGLFEVNAHDMRLIADAMQADTRGSGSLSDELMTTDAGRSWQSRLPATRTCRT